MVFIFNQWLKKSLGIVGDLFLRLFLTNFYKFYLTLKKLAVQAYQPAKSKLAFSFSHRYLVHAVLIAIALIIATVKISAHELNANFGEKTLLASLVNPSEEEFIEEKAIAQENNKIVLSYLGQEVAQTTTRPPTDTDIETEDLEEDVTSLTQGGAAILKPEIGLEPNSPRTRTNIEEYVVQNGDTISGIAANFGISINTVLWANNLTSYSYIRPGEKIKIMPISGLVHTVKKNDTVIKLASYYSANETDIRDWNNLSADAILTVGQDLIVPGGQKPRPVIAPSRLSSLSNFIAPSDIKAPAGGEMLWPVASRRITQYYSWRHHGLDIGAPMGTPIYAAESGVIEIVGWGLGYGNQIVIDHGDGKKTRYGHCSQIYAQKGQAVNKGQAIGAIGSTGWSTGPHLHFEVMIWNNKYNPLNYIR
ncbi:MAG: peptidoglycan DD-metalloendopeptidase family protein [bacterium]